MNIDNKALIDSIVETLKNDEKLSAYVKNISHGGQGSALKIFPFIEVGAIQIREEQRLAASVYFSYSVNITAGMRSLAPGVSYLGGPNGKKGINGLCDDLCSAIRGKTFNNILFPVFTISSNPNYRRDNSETMHMGVVSFSSRRIERL